MHTCKCCWKGHVAHLVDKLSIFQVFNCFLENREGLIEVDWQADAAEVFANALLEDGPQADALLMLLGGGQPSPSGRRRVHLPACRQPEFQTP